MQTNCYLSICIPTKGRAEVVKKTLISIYANQSAKQDEFEIVLSDNSNDDELLNILQEFTQHKNITYQKTNVKGFSNSIHALSLGKGKLLKLHNDYTVFKPGALTLMIESAKKYCDEQPLIFFANNELKTGVIHQSKSFENLLYQLSFLCTWSTGFSIWNQDLEQLKKTDLDLIFPHTSLLFALNKKLNYIIDDRSLFKNVVIKNKGGYNLFHAFSVLYLNMLKELVGKNVIHPNTFNYLKKDLFKRFLINWYINTKIETNSYTYDLSNIQRSINVYYSNSHYVRLILSAYLKATMRFVKRVLSAFTKNKSNL